MSAATTAGPTPNRQVPMPGRGPAGGEPAGGPHISNGVNFEVLRGVKGKSRVFPHIDDLVAVQPDVNALASIRKLLEKGESCAKQADTHLDFRHPDIALQEYIKASTIIVDLIPRHKDFPELKSDRGELHRLHVGLQKRIHIQHEKFEEIKELIKKDNARSGVQPTSPSRSTKDPILIVQHNGELRSENPPGRTESARKQPPDSTDVNLISEDSGRNSRILASAQHVERQSTRRKPPVQPKPNALHGRALQPNSTLNSHFSSDENDLAARFSRLRGAGPHSPAEEARIRTQSIGMPDGLDHKTKQDSSPLLSTGHTSTKRRPDRPLGPRDMPRAPTAPPRPQKVPLDVDIPSMPKLPDAIYSPARNLDNPENLDMLRSGSRNGFTAPGKPTPIIPTSRALLPTTGISARSDHTTPSQSLHNMTKPNQSLDLQLADGSTITAEDLFECLKRGSDALSILLVDIRDREAFNDGHIMSHSIICIEPIVLHHGISAEELEQSLVLSPEAEQRLFETRDVFDLVVYYDQSSTSSENEIFGNHGVDTTLGYFSKAVYDYGYEKRLKRAPRLLVGGLDAWVDLVGPRALETVQSPDATTTRTARGSTKAFLSPSKSRQANTITAQRTIHGARILSNEEQNKWKVALNEEVAAISPNEVTFIRTTEDFFRRFPEPSPIQESMISPPKYPTSQASDNLDQNVARANTGVSNQNSSSIVPQIPTRPVPALPKQSYSGVSERSKYSSTVLVSASPFEYKGTSTISGHSGARCGLVNTGNTCYMNATLQALKATRLIFDTILSLNTETHPLPIAKGETRRPEQLMVLAIRGVFAFLSSGQEKRYNPVNFKDYCRNIHISAAEDAERFGGKRQQDASEFVGWLLEQLHSDLNYSRARGPLMILTASQEAVRREQPAIQSSWMQWQRFCHANGSIINQTFYGQNSITITCPHCGYIQKTWDPWGQITIPIQNTPKGEASLETLLRDIHANPSKLNGYRCDQCKQEGPTTLQKISRCPDVLILVLGRNVWNGHEHVKKKTVVRFPLDGLSLDPYFISLDGRGSEQLDDSFLAPFTYDCYVIIQHFGDNPKQGHYVALVKELDTRNGKDNWFLYNDEKVSQVKDILSLSQSENTYMLFYQRRKNAK